MLAAFGRRAVVWLVLTGAGAFCVMLTLLVVGDPAGGNVTGSSVFSRSAVGHAALAELLRERGHTVKVNRSRAAIGVSERDLLLVLAPRVADHHIDHLQALVLAAPADRRAILVALPKWRTSPSTRPRGWISRAHRMARKNTARPLDAIGALTDAAVEQTKEPPEWRTAPSAVFRGLAPRIEQPQLVAHENLDPLLWAAGGDTLVGRLRGTTLAVLSDPDLLANHGLRDGDNAALTLAVIEHLLPAGGAVVFDETLHGFAIVPSLWRLLFQPPYLAATLLALAATVLVLWQAATRFGAPLPAQTGPVFRGGHETLIENAGRMLNAGGHGALVARRYAQMTVAEARRRLHLRGEPAADAVALLNALAARRGVAERLPSRGDKRRPLALARACRRWTREMFE